jgi:hypothetical protein
MSQWHKHRIRNSNRNVKDQYSTPGIDSRGIEGTVLGESKVFLAVTRTRRGPFMKLLVINSLQCLSGSRQAKNCHHLLQKHLSASARNEEQVRNRHG